MLASRCFIPMATLPIWVRCTTSFWNSERTCGSM
uniref:Uncharacterized protein n=1 Tax=Picea sitchensis TaxID=3332 RepID=A9NWP0_PICSI|nr:unknown [Picea sitchensis]